MTNQGTRVYVAGPYSQPDPVANTNYAIQVGKALRDVGYIPFIPHLTMVWHIVYPRRREDWLEYGMEWLAQCQMLLRIPGESKGADAEVLKAHELGIPVALPADRTVRSCVYAVENYGGCEIGTV